MLRLLFPIYIFSIFFQVVDRNDSVYDSVDLKNKQSIQAFCKLELYKSMEYASEALKMSEKLNYSKGKTVASIYLAKVVLELGDYKKALYYIDNAEQESFFDEYINMQVESHRLKGRIYGQLDMYVKAEKEFKKQLLLSYEIENQEKKNLSTFWAYQNLNVGYVKTNQKDSLNKYLNLQLKALNQIDESINFYGISDTYCLVADNLIEQEKYDEAIIYIDKALQLLQKYNSNYLFNVYQRYGDYERAKGNTEASLEYYNLALLNSLELKDMDAAKDFYKLIADLLILTGDKDLDIAKEYLLRYSQINDSLQEVNSNILDDIYQDIIEEEWSHREEEKKTFQYVVWGLGVALIFTLLYFYYKKKKYKEIIDVKLTETIEQKETINQLEDQLQDSRFKDIMELAQKNSPGFIILFEELYPDVVYKIKKINPDAKASEISFLALAYLNFSTKQLSQIFNVTVRAIQIRKNRLRKKYNIPSDVDFNLWYKELMRI